MGASTLNGLRDSAGGTESPQIREGQQQLAKLRRASGLFPDTVSGGHQQSRGRRIVGEICHRKKGCEQRIMDGMQRIVRDGG